MLPDNLHGLQALVRGRDDDTIYEGIGRQGVDAVLAHVSLTLLPGNVAPEGGGDAQGVVQFVLSTLDGERHLWVSRDGGVVTAGVGHAEGARTTFTMTLADLLRLLANESGKDVAAQVSAGSMRVSGDETMADAFPGWFRLPD